MVKLKLQYFGHLMWRVDSLEKTLMLGEIGGRRRREWQRMRWLDSITDSMGMSLSKLREFVDREAWRAVIHGVAKKRTQQQLNWPTESLYNIVVGFAIHWHGSATGVHMAPSWTPLSALSPRHPSGLSQCTGFECPVSCIKLGLVICFTYGNIHVSMLFSQIIPPSPSPTESKSLFFISGSLLLSHI